MPQKASQKLDGIGEVLGLYPEKGSQSAVPPTRGRWWLPGLGLDDLEPAPLPGPIAAQIRREAAKPRRRSPRASHGTPPAGEVYTFFQYLMASVFGPPLVSRPDGYALWDCPKCRQETLHSRCTHPVYKDRFQCWRCDWHGDAADVLAFHDPEQYGPGRYGAADLRLSVMRTEYDACTPRMTRPLDTPSPLGGGQCKSPKRCRWHPAAPSRLQAKAVVYAERFKPCGRRDGGYRVEIKQYRVKAKP